MLSRKSLMPFPSTHGFCDRVVTIYGSRGSPTGPPLCRVMGSCRELVGVAVYGICHQLNVGLTLDRSEYLHIAPNIARASLLPVDDVD
jgi:hypothetical protein